MADHVLTFKFGIYISLLFELLVCFDRLLCPWLLAERIFPVSSDENYEYFLYFKVCRAQYPMEVWHNWNYFS